MSNKKKRIPQLRFPEFKNEREWEDVLIESVGNVVTGGTPSKEESEYWGGDFVWVTAQDFKEKYIYNSVLKLTDKGKEKSRVIPKNSVLVTCIASIGLNGINKVECATNQQINSIVCNASNHYEFVYYAISRNITQLKNLAGQTAVPIISKSVFEKFTIQKPKLPEEQQKIASCLSSLDDLIEAHNQKLDLLKDHKKGLMQNLFPQEGEKVPKYRFKEFENEGDWGDKKLGEIGEPLMCKRIFKEQTISNPKNGIPFYKIGTFGKKADSYIPTELYEEFKHKYSFPNIGDILISASGTIGRLVVYDGLPAYFQDSNIVWLGNDEKMILNSFLYYCYSTLKWQTSDGGIISRLYNSDFKNMQVRFPKGKQEQQKIASCLSALDELIKAQAEKIEQLKLHKKGLMQGLFPKINE
jgi:type I restriction enzyme S subunit